MKNIIEELWNGEILPQENLTKDNPEYQELRHRQIKKQQELLNVCTLLRRKNMFMVWQVRKKDDFLKFGRERNHI